MQGLEIYLISPVEALNQVGFVLELEEERNSDFVQVLQDTSLTGHPNRSDRLPSGFSSLSVRPVCLTGQCADNWFKFCNLQNLLKRLFTPLLGNIRGPFTNRRG